MSKKLTKEEYLQRCRKIHNTQWDYSKLIYNGIDDKVQIGCPEHGWFWQNAYSHSKGMGCKKCADSENSKRILLKKENYIEKANLKHDNFFSYDNLDYKGMRENIIVNCPIHGDFEIIASNHLRRGCVKCNIEKRSQSIILQKAKEFINKSIRKHDRVYDYSKFEYTKATIPSVIICRVHGEFSQTPHIHLQGSGCPKCGIGNISKPEIEVQEFVKELGYKIITNNRKLIKPYELDIYIPSLKKAIEFNGDWWHYDQRNPNCRGNEYHEMKTEMCNNINIELLHIRESEWKLNRVETREKIKNFIKY